MRRGWSLILLAPLAACGGSDSGAAGGATTVVPDCVAVVATAVNGLDLAGVVADDGLDADERSRVEAELTRARAARPELAEGGACADVLAASGSSGALDRLVDHHRLDILAGIARSTFTSVAPVDKAPGAATTATTAP